MNAALTKLPTAMMVVVIGAAIACCTRQETADDDVKSSVTARYGIYTAKVQKIILEDGTSCAIAMSGSDSNIALSCDWNKNEVER